MIAKMFVKIILVLFGMVFVVSGINLITSISELDLQSESKLEYILFEKLGEMIKCFYEYPTFGSSSIMFKTNVAKNGIIGYEMYGNVVDRMMLLNCSKEHTFAYMVNPKYNALQHLPCQVSFRL